MQIAGQLKDRVQILKAHYNHLEPAMYVVIIVGNIILLKTQSIVCIPLNTIVATN